MRRITLLTALSMAAFVTLTVRGVERPLAADGDVLPFQATERTLANGLKVIVVPTGFPNLISVQIPVQVGSRNEIEPGKSGFAHFFEHLMFRGTPNTSPAKFRTVLSDAGSRDNATTSNDRTVYFATFAKAHLEPVLGLYGDMFQNLAFSEADFKTEARAVLGEYNLNSADPSLRLFEVQRDRFFKTHPYKHTTLGFVADIENMPNEYAYSKVFFERWYRPELTTVVIAGDVTAAQALPLVEKYWGSWRTKTTAPVPIPAEPSSSGPIYAHVPWASPTLPHVTVAFPAPAFNETSRERAAIDTLAGLYFGPTSMLYRQLVDDEQKVDALSAGAPPTVDPFLFTVTARVKKPADALYVRDQILATFAAARNSPPPAQQLADAKSHDRYQFARGLDSTERIAGIVARYASYRRSFGTANAYYRTLASVEAADVLAVARKYFTDSGLIVTTLSDEALPAGIERLPAIVSIAPARAFEAATLVPSVPASRPPSGARQDVRLVLQKSALPQINTKLLFDIGSAHDPAGKEGLAAMTAVMIADAGSRHLTIDQIRAALYPVAGAFVVRVDKEMTTFTALTHREQWPTVFGIVLSQLTDPGFREEDFRRQKDAQTNALLQDLRTENEEELGKERLQTNLFRGSPYGHVSLGTVAGLKAITLDDVREFARRHYTRENLRLGVNGDAPEAMLDALRGAVAALPAGTATPRVKVEAKTPDGLDVEIVEKESRSTAISLGFPIAVTRTHPDFAALWLARAWLGEHRLTSGQLFQRIRAIRGINYGDYAYIEAFPRGMFQFFPDPNVARQRQIFEIWIRPVVPVNAHMTLRIAIHELDQMIQKGLTAADFEKTRSYLMNNVFVMTALQDQQLGYALDSAWYGMGEYTGAMRAALEALTVERVNAAIRRHLDVRNLSLVAVTKDAAGLKQALVADEPSTIRYDGEKPASLLEEDRIIGARNLNISAGKVKITPVADVFTKSSE